VKASAVKRTGAGDGEYHLHASEPIDMDLGDTTFYDYQQAIIDHITGTVMEEQHGCAYMTLFTGGGKTRTAIGIMAVLSVKTIVVVPAKSLQSQWLKELSVLSPNTVAIAYSNPLGELVECDVAICVVNTFRGKDLTFLRDNGFGLVIFDEAHEYYTKMNSNALWLAQGAEFVLGLSATPLERKDGLDTFVTHFLGKPVLQESIPGFDVEQGAFPGAVTKINYECDIEYADTKLTSRGTPCNASTLSLVLSDPDRMILVARRPCAPARTSRDGSHWTRAGDRSSSAPSVPPLAWCGPSADHLPDSSTRRDERLLLLVNQRGHRRQLRLKGSTLRNKIDKTTARTLNLGRCADDRVVVVWHALGV
jgi:hypothetical protein